MSPFVVILARTFFTKNIPIATKNFFHFKKGVFFDIVLDQIEAIANYKSEQIEEMEKRQIAIEERMQKMQGILDNIEKDITLSSIRASEKFRLIGYRQEQYFYIVWFDRNHLTYKG